MSGKKGALVFLAFLASFSLIGSVLASNEAGEIHRRSNSKTTRFSKETTNQKIGSLIIEKHSIDYCQLRIDFDTFESIGQVNEQGKCQGGQWTLLGQIQENVPTLCGYNTGQHVYADFDSRGSQITMNITTDNEDAQWDVRVTQIACDDNINRVSLTCLQYYSSVNGNFQSFNYQNIQTNDPPVTYQLANQNYYICFGSGTHSSIRYTRGTGAFDFYFSITGLVSIVDPIYLGTNLVADVDAKCTADYVGIPSGTYTDASGNGGQIADKFCGLGFPLTVTSTSQPFALYVYTDSTEPPLDDGNVGFSLFYQLS